MKRITLALSFAIVSAVAAPLGAQQLRPSTDGVPKGYRPPPGMCRIWIDGVPANRQSAPTDCATAVRNRPSNGRVIFGEDSPRRGNDKPKAEESKQDDDKKSGGKKGKPGRD